MMWGATWLSVIGGILVWINFVGAVRSQVWPLHEIVSLGLLALVFPIVLSARWLRLRHPHRAYILLAVSIGLIVTSLIVWLWWGYTPL
jgi:hypothetical protein